MFYSLATRPVRSFQRSNTPVVSNDALDRYLNGTLASMNASNGAHTASVEDLEHSYSLTLDVPGLAREQLDIGIEADVVRVSSKEDAARKVKAAWRFPLEIDATNSSAKLENGVLTLTLGKKVAVSKITSLAIN